MVEIFLEEAMDLLESAGESLEAWLASPQSNVMSALLRDLHTLKGGARMAEIPEIGDLAHELEFLYEDLSAGKLNVSDALLALLQDSHDALAIMLEAVRDSRELPDAHTLMTQIKNMRANKSEQLDVPTSLKVATTQHSAQENNDEVLSIFIVEADELLTELSTALAAFDDTAQSTQALNDALRVLNTLKGGARLAEAQSIGNISHELESQYKRVYRLCSRIRRVTLKNIVMQCFF
jgi:chemosensory pili system protein ChpA (sensor histidine kinase/response regulator)